MNRKHSASLRGAVLTPRRQAPQGSLTSETSWAIQAVGGLDEWIERTTVDQLFDDTIRNGVLQPEKTAYKLFDFFANGEYCPANLARLD